MMTKVIFRMSEGEVVAVFPQLPGTNDPNTMTCYAHVGQHGSCGLDWYYTTTPAAPVDSATLLRELALRYDDLEIGRRITNRDDAQRREALRR